MGGFSAASHWCGRAELMGRRRGKVLQGGPRAAGVLDSTRRYGDSKRTGKSLKT
jgi:hypothetical protein